MNRQADDGAAQRRSWETVLRQQGVSEGPEANGPDVRFGEAGKEMVLPLRAHREQEWARAVG